MFIAITVESQPLKTLTGEIYLKILPTSNTNVIYYLRHRRYYT